MKPDTFLGLALGIALGFLTGVMILYFTAQSTIEKNPNITLQEYYNAK